MFQIAAIPKHRLKTDLLVLFFNKTFIKRKQKVFNIFPKNIAQFLEKYFKYKDFKAEFKDTALLYPEDGSSVKRILLIGLGYESKLSLEQLRETGYLIAGFQDLVSGKKIHIFSDNLSCIKEDFINAISEGIHFKNYSFEEYKTEQKKSKIQHQYTFIFNNIKNKRRYSKTLLETALVMRGVNVTRDLANQPSNSLTPARLKDFVLKHFKKYDNINIEVLDKNQLKSKNFNALLAVSKGSVESPYLIIIKYKPEKNTKKKLALIGKGVTFDAGGISIKPSANMDEMKYDMAGAAAVIGMLDIFAKIKPKFEIIGLIPAVENMPGGNAVKPGDIIKAYNGKTIEIINTDAEGRLILADTLSFAVERFKPNAIIDFATLTGSCVVALGDKMAGLFTNSDELAEVFIEAGSLSGDRVWRMPVSDLYSKEIKSEIADIKNLGGKWAGAITAAKFLEHFIGKTRWAHIDLAGTAYNVKDIDYLAKGATGFGPRLMAAVIKKLGNIL
jgi:leucyl aminopeptidase